MRVEYPGVIHHVIPWLLFVAAIVVSFFVHELGHCAVAWLHGYPAIPTPMKEYVLKPISEAVQYQVALGGILGSVAALLAAVFWFHRHPTAACSAMLAGAMTAPGFYTLRFILAGRGHDSTEFQEAQAALGLSYPGHAADWLFVSLFVMATAFWFLRTRARPTPRLVGRLAVGAVAALVVLVLLQSVNNAVFDPLFEPKTGHNHQLAHGDCTPLSVRRDFMLPLRGMIWEGRALRCAQAACCSRAFRKPLVLFANQPH
jgi:hypothetical protein